VLAIDVPTGIDASTGAVADIAVRATLTVTLGAPKIGCYLDPARDYVGELWLGDIGLGPEIDALTDAGFRALDDAEFRALLPQRAAETDKRRAGAPLIIAGSKQFPGAAVLCARGAARAGAGYVTVAAPRKVAPLLRTHLVEQVVVSYDSSNVDKAVQMLLDLSNHAAAVGIGPGLALDEATGQAVLTYLQRTKLPLVADASALYHLKKHAGVLRGKQAVLTPHAREFGRLSGGGTIMPGTRVARLRAFVEQYGVTTLLKGRTTLIDDGTAVHVNPTGTNALATAGTGDVLTGMIATLLAQGLSPVDAARAAAYWHGLAGQAAARHRPIGVVAGDIPEALGGVLAPPSARLSGLTRIF
jgi:hydroxyethylthiazole kinase-like uncharacterized protein yjeF